MDRKQLIGFILIFATLMLWTMFTKPSDEVLAKRKHIRDSIARAGQVIDTFGTAAAPSALPTDTAKVDSLSPKAETFVLENDEIKVTLSNEGGKITSVELKKHVRSDIKNNGKPVSFLDNPKNRFDLTAETKSGSFSTAGKVFNATRSANSVTFSTTTTAGEQVSQTYTLDNAFGLTYDVKHNLALTSNPTLRWFEILPKLERSDVSEQNLSTVYYKQAEENTADYCSCTGNDEQKVNEQKIDWVSHSNQFFNSSLMAKNFKFQSGDFTSERTNIKLSDDLKAVTSVLSLPKDVSNYQMQFYLGPNVFGNLKKYDVGLEQIIPFGASFFGTINRYIVRPSFDFLSTLISNKGIVIILLIFIIKMLLYPLLYKMLHGQAKMAALKPEMDIIKAKNKDDLQKQQMESMKVYQEYGVSPLSGCMPMLLQMPIWIALYRFFPASITFRKEPFLWADDLSTYDSIASLPFEIPMFGAHISLFTVLWAISTLVYTYYSTKDVDMSANPAMKYVQYIMPVMFLGFFNSYASGLTAYMFFSNLINIIQIIVTKNFLFDKDKIRAELDIQKSKPKKVGGFQAKLQEAMQQQQEQAAKRSNKSK